MILMKVNDIKEWVKKTRESPFIAVLCGFTPDNTPGTGTYYDFEDRIVRGPYRPGITAEIRRNGTEYRYMRNLKAEKEAKKEARKLKKEFRPNDSQSDSLVTYLLENAEKPRPEGLRRVLSGFLFASGVIPSIEQGLITGTEKLTVHGDGSVQETAASSRGKSLCKCKEKCECPKSYTSKTAEWCYNAVLSTYKFGDRFYHIVLTQNGHDFPLLTVMPGGNESDYTLSLKAFDTLLKIIREHELKMNIDVFAGDGHHDTYAHYRYFAAKDVKPVVPLSENSKKNQTVSCGDGKTSFGKDGIPLCPGGKTMRRHTFNKRKQTYVYSCPAKRNTHRDGKSLYVFHEEECPLKENCLKKSSLGPFVYIKTDTDPRLYPPIPRGSKKYKDVMNQRSGSERLNSFNDAHVPDRSCRDARRSLVRLTFANIIKHAVIRFIELTKKIPIRDAVRQQFEKIMNFSP
jgi:hypothetical protein